MFETTIRVLGGLLSAYDLSHDRVFLTKVRRGCALAGAMVNPRGRGGDVRLTLSCVAHRLKR